MSTWCFLSFLVRECWIDKLSGRGRGRRIYVSTNAAWTRRAIVGYATARQGHRCLLLHKVMLDGNDTQRM